MAKKKWTKKFILPLLVSVIFIILIILGIFVWKYISASSSHFPFVKQIPVPHIRDNNPTLVSNYVIHDSNPDYAEVKYRPRQFAVGVPVDNNPAYPSIVTDAGNYNGWDFLNLPAANKNANNWFTVYLNRSADIVLVWRAAEIPPWLSGWKPQGNVSLSGKSYPVFIKQISSERFSLPAVKRDIPAYTLLFGEKSGKPSTEPKTPQGLPIPIANQTCPDWVHNEFKAYGPDGKIYPTWHPQIDPVYWCYFRHEHGVNPAAFDSHFSIPFGYAGNAMGMHEAHPGYKVYVWDDQYGYRWLALQHQGTATNQAACGQHHELDVAAKNKQTGEIVSEQFFVGNYGASKTLTEVHPLTPSACPNQGEKDGSGVRYLPIAAQSDIHEEPWTVSSEKVIGFNFAGFTVNTEDSMRMCKDMICDQIVYTHLSGSNHTIGYVIGFGPKAGTGHEGIYYTDPMGYMIMSAKEKGIVRQYIKPGVSISSNIPYVSTSEATCRDVDGTETLMTCGQGITSIPADRENSITLPN